MNRLTYKEKNAYFYLIPGLFFFCTFNIYPLVYNFYLSFFAWDAVSPVKEFIGFSHYKDMFTDRVFWIILKNTAIYAFVTVFVQMFLGIVIAVFLFKNLKGTNLYRGIIFVPIVIAPVAIGIVFSSMFRSFDGDFNQILRAIGLAGLAQDWLGDPKLAIYSIIGVNIWQWTGFSMVMYLSGMTSIPLEIYESAELDGASQTQSFISLTVPLLQRTHISLILLGTIGAFKVFDLVFILTKGGPYSATEFFATYIYRSSFTESRMGYGATLSVVLMILTLLISLIQIKLTGTKSQEEKS